MNWKIAESDFLDNQKTLAVIAIHAIMGIARGNVASRHLQKDKKTMLACLWDLWTRHQTNRPKLELEIGQWTSQHCLDADDFAFGLAFAMTRWVNA